MTFHQLNHLGKGLIKSTLIFFSSSSTFKKQHMYTQVFTLTYVCISTLHTDTHKDKLAKCSMLRVISGYPIMLTALPGKTQDILLHDPMAVR